MHTTFPFEPPPAAGHAPALSASSRQPAPRCRLRRIRCLAVFLLPLLTASATAVAPAPAASDPGAAAEATTLQILPADFALHGPAARQPLLVERARSSTLLGPVSEPVTWTTSNDQVVRIEQGIALPVGNGRATIAARVGSLQATAEVQVQHMDVPHHWEFRRHVLPVLARAGCNSGACHGALAGKGGFRLSLRGYDPQGDYFHITREARGRRIELSDPARSLLLAKPSGALPHKGGLRLPADSPDYQVVAGWLVDGAAPPREDDPVLERIEVLPEAVRVQPGATQPLLVRAFYSDGRQEDVTRWAKYSSSDQSVATVDEQGNVQVIGHGEGAIVVWFSSRIVLARIASPYPHSVAPEIFAQAERNNFIDELVLKKLASLNLAPSPRSSDREFLRRVYLDTIGTLPTAAETQAFLQDARGDKRQRLIEDLLARPEFVDYWTYKWSDLLLINGRRLRPRAVSTYYDWLRTHVQQNTPWDELVRQIVTATGSTVENGATNFYSLHQEPESMTENVSQAFLGLSIACAKCHNHPLEKWTNDQYYAMANLFARVKAKGWGGDSRSGDGVRTIFVAEQGELVQPLTGKPQPPTPLDGEPLPFDDPRDRREYLADWLTSPENPYFSRAITNRIWANFFGKGIIEPVDDLRVSNPASNERLLSAAAEYLVEHDYDLKALMRVILQSATYQRTSQPLPENEQDQRFFSRYYPRRLPAEVLLDAIAQVSQVPSQFQQIGYDGNDFEKTDQYPQGTRAIQLQDSAVVSTFLKTFGRNERDITCECERSNTPSLVQVLHINNGVTINERLAAQDSCVGRALQADLPDEQVIEQAYLSTLARYPTERERTELLQVMQAAADADRRDLIEDVYWGIMSSREFLFNH